MLLRTRVSQDVIVMSQIVLKRIVKNQVVLGQIAERLHQAELSRA